MKTYLEIENKLMQRERKAQEMRARGRKLQAELERKKKERKEGGFKDCAIIEVQCRWTRETNVISNSLEWIVYDRCNPEKGKEEARCKEFQFFDHLKSAINHPESFHFDGASKYEGREGAGEYVKLHVGRFSNGHPMTIFLRDTEHNVIEQITFNS